MEDTEIERPPIRADGLQIEEDRTFQERVWSSERAALGAFAVIVLAALSGLAGSGGPLAERRLATEAGTIEYPRVMRWETADRVVLRLAATRPTHEVVLFAPFADRFEIDAVQPVPLTARAGQERLSLDFASDGAAGTEVVLSIRPSAPGLVRYRIGLDGAAPVTLRHLVLP